MNKFVKVNIARSYNGVSKVAPDRGIDPNQMIDLGKEIEKDMKLSPNLSVYHGFSRITGLTLKGME